MTTLKKDFDEVGYVALRGFLDADEVEELQRETNRFTEETVSTLPEQVVYYEDKSNPVTLKQVQRIHEHDDYFMRLATSEKVVGLAEELLGGPVTIQNMQYFNKFPRMGKATPPHQDGYYFMI